MSSQQDVSHFIRASFRSVWSLELLLYLKKHDQRAWSHEELVAALRGSELIVAQSLDSLAAAGLIIVDQQGCAHYRPAAGDLDALVTQTQALYARSPDAVRRMIVAAAHGGLAAFADAFRLRKD